MSFSTHGNHWIAVKTAGVKSNRSSALRPFDDGFPVVHRSAGLLRNGSSNLWQSELRAGLGPEERADLETHWPSGTVDRLAGVKANQVVTVKEGTTVRA